LDESAFLLKPSKGRFLHHLASSELDVTFRWRASVDPIRVGKK